MADQHRSLAAAGHGPDDRPRRPLPLRPSRDEAKWKWVSPGAIVASIGWLVGSLLFSWYVANFEDYNKTYGALGALIGLLTWMWLSATIVLVGAELNSETERQTLRDTTKGPPKPIVLRGADAADSKRDEGASCPHA